MYNLRKASTHTFCASAGIKEHNLREIQQETKDEKKKRILSRNEFIKNLNISEYRLKQLERKNCKITKTKKRMLIKSRRVSGVGQKTLHHVENMKVLSRVSKKIIVSFLCLKKLFSFVTHVLFHFRKTKQTIILNFN